MWQFPTEPSTLSTLMSSSDTRNAASTSAKRRCRQMCSRHQAVRVPLGLPITYRECRGQKGHRAMGCRLRAGDKLTYHARQCWATFTCSPSWVSTKTLHVSCRRSQGGALVGREDTGKTSLFSRFFASMTVGDTLPAA